MIEVGYYVLLELQIHRPAKLDEKLATLNEIIDICKSNKVQDALVTDSYYVSGKSPERPQIFEIIIFLRGTIESIISIAKSFREKYTYEKLSFYPRIFVSRNKEFYIEIKYNSKKNDLMNRFNENGTKNTLQEDVIQDVEVIMDHDR